MQNKFTTRYKRNDDILATEMDGVTIMMSIEEGKYFELSTVSTRIWELLESPLSINDICESLLSEYDVSEEKCRLEVINHLEELKYKKIILPV